MKALDPRRSKINYPTKLFLGDVWRFIRPYKRNFFLGSFSRLAADLVWLYPAVAVAGIVDGLTAGKDSGNYSVVWTYVFLYTLCSLVQPTLKNYAKKLLYEISDKTSLDLEFAALRHMFALDVQWHEKESTGNKLKGADIAGRGMATLMRLWVNNLISLFVNLVGMPVILFQFDRGIAIAVALVMVLRLFVSRRFSTKIGAFQYDLNQKGEDLNGLYQEGMSNVRTVKVMAAVGSLTNIMSKAVNDFFIDIKKFISLNQWRSFVLDQTFLLFRVGMYIYIVIEVINGHAEVGLFILATTYLNAISGSVDELANASQEITIARYNLTRVREIFEQKVNTSSEEGKVTLPREWQRLEIEHLSFQYGENEVLNDISFEIKRGEKIGVVGLSGAGKSTLFKLLLKEYEDYKGLIKFDGLNLREVSPKDYYAHTAVVLQETEVFNFSLKDNVTIGREKYTKSSFDKALEISHVQDFLHKLPQGVDTLIGEKGVKLSGGEKQRLGIARAVYKEPELLLLDEATSHLDIESEKSIQDSLHQFFESVTAIVIAHRLTTIKEMDRIIVIEGGKLVEQGSFSKLMKTPGGRFRELWKKQKI